MPSFTCFIPDIIQIFNRRQIEKNEPNRYFDWLICQTFTLDMIVWLEKEFSKHLNEHFNLTVLRY